jgi:cell wall-associated NlpC family hydrolase
MRRVTRGTAALVGLAAAVLATGTTSSATADPLGSARAQAAALTKTVARLQTRTEVATEQYDAVEARLNDAVAERGRADQALNAVQQRASTAAQTVADRARALYETGGDSSVLASVITGQNAAAALESYRLAGDILSYESRTAHAAALTVTRARVLDARDASVSRSVTKLQVAARADATKVETALATQRRALAAANGTVRRIMRADQMAAAAASAADFTTTFEAAGGTIDPSGSTAAPNNVAAEAIAAARNRLGVPYVWGATGPDAFDCSGLTQWSYAHAGIALPRTAAEQWNAGPHPALADLEPGDLLFWALNTSDPATIHHVAMYIGSGMMIAAPHTGENVQIQPVYMAGFIGAVRPWATLGRR